MRYYLLLSERDYKWRKSREEYSSRFSYLQQLQYSFEFFSFGNFFSFHVEKYAKEWKVKIAKSKSWVARYLEELPVLMAIVKV